MVRRLNVEGDGQGDRAGHGGEQRAVMVYQIDSYRYWQQQLGRDDFVYGQFGENFTVDGLADDEVCIGDRYRIGDAVFEVTQPRVTCYRVGMRMDEPRMPALLVAHHRPGFYLRVLAEGQVEAGSEIVKVASGPESLTVAEMDALLYLPGHPRQGLARALRIPALSPGWKASLQALLDQPSDQGKATGNPGLTAAAESPPPAWSGFRPLRVERIDAESRSVFSLHLAAADGAPLPAALPGQYLTLRLKPDTESSPLIRSYSLSGPPGAPQYRISVKQEPHGAAGSYLHTRVQVGDVLDVAAPRGSFTLHAGDAPILLLSAGVGATPVLAMLHALAAERSTREVWWLHGARNAAEHPFAEESRALLAGLPNAHCYVCYSDPAPEDRAGVDYETAGRLSADVVGRLGIPRTAEAYLCGPPAFMHDLTATLAALGIDASRVHTEFFGAGAAVTPGIAPAPTRPPHPPAGAPGAGPSVSFVRSGLTVNWDSTYASLLELAEACSVVTRWSCRTGVCHTCETGIFSGAVTYSPEPIEAPAEGNALICCSQPRGAVVLDL
jgi:ferredoxin-NADP reductase/MOSC domain-containing protein YiiM/ferredoxin